MVIENKWLRYCSMFGGTCLIIVLGVMAFRVVKAKYENAMVAGKELSKIAKKIDRMIHYDELTHWQREEWELDTFFHTREAIKACEYISSKDTAGLSSWILAGGDINLAGDHGMTLLFWAMLDRNMDAFQELLTQGADPTITLSSAIPLKFGRYMYKDDSVLFAATEFHEFNFLLAALPFHSNPNHTCIGGLNLISRITESNTFFYTPPYVFAGLVHAGVNPDVRQGRYDSVPAATLVSLQHPASCLAIITAGADPTFQSAGGDSVVSVVRRRFGNHDPVTTLPAFQKLTLWLIEQGYLEPAILKVNPGSSPKVAKP